jgi:replication factor C subunit 3/5
MFLVDKYYNELDNILCYQSIINNVLNKDIYKMFNDNKYNNLQHIILYGSSELGKKYIINKILENIYGSVINDIKDIEYMISGYSNVKTKVTIKQSKHHIIIEPNSNGFDKYLIQEIIQEYAKTNCLNIIANYHEFKVIIINKIDKLSYYAQAALRRTMEKYSNTCKFILINDQLSNIIEPVRSRCLLVRIPLLTNSDIMFLISNIAVKENIKLDYDIFYNIVKKSNCQINKALWLLNMQKYNITYEEKWLDIIDGMINEIINVNNYTPKKLLILIKYIRQQFYILFITNISTQEIIKTIMNKLLKLTENIDMRYNIIDLTSEYESRLHQGTRHIIHIESYVLKLINLFYNLYKNN